MQYLGTDQTGEAPTVQSASPTVPPFSWVDAKREAKHEIAVDTLKTLYWVGIGLAAYAILPKNMIQTLKRGVRRFL